MDVNRRLHILDLTQEDIGQLLVAAGRRRFHASQVTQWIYQRGCRDFAEMTDLPKGLRAELAQRFAICMGTIARHLQANDGTRKLLLTWPDGATTESVLIPDRSRQTACISTQVGCPVGCRFCASGLEGMQRNLTAGQIVEQAMQLSSRLPPRQRLSNVVLMGSGEPLANYDATVRAIRTLNADWGPRIGARRITISTVGLPKQIRRLADEQLQLNLAISLHAPNDGLRADLIPWAKRIPIAELFEAARYYFERTGREVTIEYVLLAGVNDQTAHARELAELAKRIRCHVNLLRYNPVAALPFERPTASQAYQFQQKLRQAGVNCQVRKSRGSQIDAACGQLRRAALAEEPVAQGPRGRDLPAV